MKSIILAAALVPFQALFAQQATPSPRRRRRGELNPRELSDHVKRDMGFLDGKQPAGSIK